MAYPIHNHRLTGIPYNPSPNGGGPLRARLIVIHYTASGEGFDTAAWFAEPAARASAHLVIRRDGTMVQCMPFDRVAWHAGRSRWRDPSGLSFTRLNRHAIGIELENWGALERTPAGWVSWSGAPVDSSLVTEACHKWGAPDCGWETYTPLQMEAVREVAAAISAAYPISDIVGHDDIAPGRKSDPGPAFDMAGLRRHALGRDEAPAA